MRSHIYQWILMDLPEPQQKNLLIVLVLIGTFPMWDVYRRYSKYVYHSTSQIGVPKFRPRTTEPPRQTHAFINEQLEIPTKVLEKFGKWHSFLFFSSCSCCLFCKNYIVVVIGVRPPAIVTSIFFAFLSRHCAVISVFVSGSLPLLKYTLFWFLLGMPGKLHWG